MKQADGYTRVPIAARESCKSRRVYPDEFKREVVAQCFEPGASVSAILLAHGINAGVIRKWLARQKVDDNPRADNDATRDGGQRCAACDEQTLH